MPTAIYYHFGTKEELLHQALKSAMDQFSEHVATVHPAEEPADADTLRRVIRAGWEWWSLTPKSAC